jgi:hypothetical protein
MANNITVTYVPQTTGCHNICYKLASGPFPIPPDAAFCCIQDIIIAPNQVGVSRIIVIDAGVTPCTSGSSVTAPTIAGTYLYEGYIETCCLVGEVNPQTLWPNNASIVIP